jgi:RNA polymerase sigma-70 factor (ECF subfamily)
MPLKVTIPEKEFSCDEPASLTQNSSMLRRPHVPNPAPDPATGALPSAGEACAADVLSKRGDGKLDWSIAMARAQGGDKEAYRQLLEGITPYIRALASRHIRNRDDIEDTVQDVLLTIHSVRNTYDPSRPFGPWLVAIAKRRIVDTLRRGGRVGSHEIPLEPGQETFFAAGANIEEAADAQVVWAAIEQLSAGQRDAVRMLKLEEMSLQEAATFSGMSVAALKVATHRAIKRLREVLQRRGNKE